MRIKSQFWESPSFGLLQQINQVLLILVIFACWSLFFPRNYYSGLFLYTRRHFIEPSSTSSHHHLGKSNKSPTSQRINHHQHCRPKDYTERAYRHRRMVTSSSRHRPRHDLHRQGRTIASSSRCPSRRTTSTPRLTWQLQHLLTDMLRLLVWTGGFVIPSSTYSRDFGVVNRPTSSR